MKGAYWDTELAHARAEGWPVPVYERKAESDANFERCVRLLHDHHGEVRAAFGSHNLRSLAYAVASPILSSLLGAADRRKTLAIAELILGVSALVIALAPLAVDWSTVFAVLAAVTMTGGNIVALVQTNTKRMLAYSSIAHTGYILAAVAASAAGPSAGSSTANGCGARS